MTPEEKNRKRELLREFVIEFSSGCVAQTGIGNVGWPCGTCFNHVLGELGVGQWDHEHCDPVDRINEVWRALLEIRDVDYEKEQAEIDELEAQV